MIVDSMTDEEILQELKKDEPGVFAMMKAQLLKDFKSKYLQSFHSFPICYTREIVSNRRNRFIALFYLDGKPNARGKLTITNMESYHLAVHFRQGKGYYVYSWNAAAPKRLLKIVPHFFTRYAERVGVEGNPLDVIKHYLKKNRKGLGVVAVYKDRRYTAFVLETGISLGVMEGNVATDLTFVSFDILFSNQKDWHSAMLKNLHDRLQLGNDAISPKERSRLWREIAVGMEMEDDVYKEFWRLFARYHLRKDVEVTRGDLPDIGMTRVFVLVDKQNSIDCHYFV